MLSVASRCMRPLDPKPSKALRTACAAVLALAMMATITACGGDDVESQETDDTFTIGGVVSGLESDGLVLQNNDDDSVVVDSDGYFEFGTELESGDSYDVTIVATPDEHDCTVDDGSGVVEDADVTDVTVQCSTSGEPNQNDPNNGELDSDFAVVIDTSASTLDVAPGQSVEIVVDVENTGDEQGTQTIELAIDDMTEDSRSLTLDSDEDDTITLQWQTDSDDSGDYTASVTSDDDSDEATVSVEAPAHAFFAVQIDEVASTLVVEETESLIVVADVENTGGESDTQDVVLEVDGIVEDVHEDLDLSTGDSQTVVLQADTDVGDAGTSSAVVLTDDADDIADVTIESYVASGEFSVEIDEGQSQLAVDAGEVVDVAVDVHNLADTPGTQNIVLEIDGAVVDSETDLSLDADEDTTLLLHWQTDSGDEGDYTATVSSDDDSDTADVAVSEPPVTGALSGNVDDADPGEYMAGVDVVLLSPGTDDIEYTTTVELDGSYEITDVAVGDYDVRLQAPGLEPNYEISEAAGGSTLPLTIEEGENVQNMTVSWQSTIDLIIDGGFIDFYPDDDDQWMLYPMPECELQPDLTWEPQPVDTEAEHVEHNGFEPDDCYRIEGVEVDLLTGELDFFFANVVFPEAEMVIDDEQDEIHANVDWVEVEFLWRIDDVEGDVDFTDGSLDIDFDLRILLGGTFHVTVVGQSTTFDFGARNNRMDCQLTHAWGGDIEDPETDDNDEQSGDYLHEPIHLQVTTGDSGPDAHSGQSYDVGERHWLGVDNSVTVGRMSEGAIGEGDPGGASCGSFNYLGFSVDYAAEMNDMMGLSTVPGDVLSEFNLYVPEL